MFKFLSNHIYLAACIVQALLWLLVILKTRNYRKLISLGVVFGVGAVIIDQLYALHDYWSPVYVFGRGFPIEDFLYGFFFGGLLAGVYEAFHEPVSYRTTKPARWLALVVAIVTVVLFYVTVNVMGLNSITAHILPPFIAGLIVVAKYPYLFKHAAASALLAVAITLLGFRLMFLLDPYFIEKVWMLDNLSGILVWGIPIEELLFAGALGFGAAFFYEVARGVVPLWGRKDSVAAE